jgi:hypothetical protein
MKLRFAILSVFLVCAHVALAFDQEETFTNLIPARICSIRPGFRNC